MSVSEASHPSWGKNNAHRNAFVCVVMALTFACIATGADARRQPTAQSSSSFQQFNATLYLYANETPIATWGALPFSETVKQVLWWEPLGFILLFQDAAPRIAEVQRDGSIVVSQWPTQLVGGDSVILKGGGVGAVKRSVFAYVSQADNASVYVVWCNASMACVARNVSLPDVGHEGDVEVLDMDAYGPGAIVVGTSVGLAIIYWEALSSSFEWVAMYNTTGGFSTLNHYISKVLVDDATNTVLATSREAYSTSNAWCTDLVHVVQGSRATYFYRAPGIIDATPTAFVPDTARGGVHMGNIVCDNFLYSNGTFDRIAGAFEGGLPQRNITCGALNAQTQNVWFGTKFGVSMLRPDGSWKYFFGPRWLPGSGFTTGMDVQSLAVGQSSVVGGEVVLVATDTGLSLIYTITWSSMDDKAAFYQAQVPRFLRYGLVSQLSLGSFGNTRQFEQTPTANDGLWTSLYLGSESMRYAATGDPQAAQQAWNAFEGMQMLINVTGDLGFPARNFIEHSLPCPSSYFPSPSMPGFCWNGDTSSDEIVGHLHGYVLLYHLVANSEQDKARVAATISNILGGIVRNNFTLVSPQTHQPTTWGRWDPQYLNFDPDWYDDRGVNSVQIISYLVTAYAITEDPLFADAFWYLVNEYSYDQNVVDAKITQPSDINYSDDELTFPPYLSFLFGKTLRNGTANPLFERVAPMMWLSIERTHRFVAKEKPSFYNAIYVAAAVQLAGKSASTDPSLIAAVNDAQWWMETYTVWQVDWPVNNAVRIDAVFPSNDIGRSGPGTGTTHTLTLFPYDELSMMRWNSNPFRTQQGSGYSELDPSPFLYPFWTGRYFRLW